MRTICYMTKKGCEVRVRFNEGTTERQHVEVYKEYYCKNKKRFVSDFRDCTREIAEHLLEKYGVVAAYKTSNGWEYCDMM